MIQNNIMAALRQCPLFHGMSEVSIELALGEIPYQTVHYDRHEQYILAGMPCQHADIVVSGVLVCRMFSFSGKQVEVSRLRAGNMIAPAFIFAKDRQMPVSVATETAVTVFRLRPEVLKMLIDRDQQIRMNFIQTLSNIDVFLTQKMKVLSLFTVREKVAYMLLENAGEQNSNVIQLSRSRQEIANSFGIQKFSLLRVLNDLEKEGVIRVEGKTITILSREKLR